MHSLKRAVDRHPLIVAAVAVLAIKLATFAVDSTPMFFMGDSEGYIRAAVFGDPLKTHPPGYVLPVRWFAVWPGTLTTLVLAQVLAGAATAWLLALLLLRFLQLRPAIAVAAAVICALEPLHVIHERLVLAEAFTQLLFALHLAIAGWYLTRPRLAILLIACVSGILLVSFRVVYVPLALATPVLLPLLAGMGTPDPPLARRVTRYVPHALAGIVVTLCLHVGYRHWIGELSDLPPAYVAEDGYSLAAAWAPLLKPEDASDPRARRVVERLLTDDEAPLSKRYARERHRWWPGGLVARLEEEFAGDEKAANRAAKAMALHAFWRNPLAAVGLTIGTYGDHWRIVFRSLHRRILTEQGTGRELNSEFLRLLKKRFGLAAAGIPFTMTPTKWYHLAVRPWYPILLLSPFIMLASVPLSRPDRRPVVAYVFLTGMIVLGTTCATAHHAFWRYLLPLAFTNLLALGVIADAVDRRLRQRLELPTSVDSRPTRL